MAAKVVAEVIVADRDDRHDGGEVDVADGACQADGGLAVAAFVLCIGEGDEGSGEHPDVAGVLEDLEAATEQSKRLIWATEAKQWPVVVVLTAGA